MMGDCFFDSSGVHNKQNCQVRGQSNLETNDSEKSEGHQNRFIFKDTQLHCTRVCIYGGGSGNVILIKYIDNDNMKKKRRKNTFFSRNRTEYHNIRKIQLRLFSRGQIGRSRQSIRRLDHISHRDDIGRAGTSGWLARWHIDSSGRFGHNIRFASLGRWRGLISGDGFLHLRVQGRQLVGVDLINVAPVMKRVELSRYLGRRGQRCGREHQVDEIAQFRVRWLKGARDLVFDLALRVDRENARDRDAHCLVGHDVAWFVAVAGAVWVTVVREQRLDVAQTADFELLGHFFDDLLMKRRSK